MYRIVLISGMIWYDIVWDGVALLFCKYMYICTVVPVFDMVFFCACVRVCVHVCVCVVESFCVRLLHSVVSVC